MHSTAASLASLPIWKFNASGYANDPPLSTSEFLLTLPFSF